MCLKELSRSKPSHNLSSPPDCWEPVSCLSCALLLTLTVIKTIFLGAHSQYCLSQGPFFLCTCSRLLPASVTRHSPCPPTLKPHPSQSHILVEREKRKNRDCSRTKPAKTYVWKCTHTLCLLNTQPLIPPITNKPSQPPSQVLSLLNMLQSSLQRDCEGRVLLLDGVVTVQMVAVALLIIVHQFSGKHRLHLKHKDVFV